MNAGGRSMWQKTQYLLWFNRDVSTVMPNWLTEGSLLELSLKQHGIIIDEGIYSEMTNFSTRNETGSLCHQCRNHNLKPGCSIFRDSKLQWVRGHFFPLTIKVHLKSQKQDTFAKLLSNNTRSTPMKMHCTLCIQCTARSKGQRSITGAFRKQWMCKETADNRCQQHVRHWYWQMSEFSMLWSVWCLTVYWILPSEPRLAWSSNVINNGPEESSKKVAIKIYTKKITL